MAEVFVRRGGTEVSFKAWQETPGSVAFGIDVGKPYANIREKAGDVPRAVDNFGAVETLTGLGVFEGSTAYEDARTLAEDIIRPYSDGEPLLIDATQIRGISQEYEVAANLASALRLNYQSGDKDRVDVAMSTPIVRETIG